MPTYAFTTMRHLSSEQRGKLVESVTIIHLVEAMAPRYFVQVVFYTVEPGSMFIGGEAAYFGGSHSNLEGVMNLSSVYRLD